MDLNVCLNKYYESKIKIDRGERSEALAVWEKLVKDILDEVKRLDARFSMQMQYTGSFYERVKTHLPDEFDLMLVLDKIQAEIRGKVVVHGFTSIYITDSQRQSWSRDSIVDSKGRLNACQMRAVFSRLVTQAISNIQTRHSGKTVTVATHGPAVTLTIKIGQTRYDVDLTLAIKLPTWPPTAKTWRSRSRRGWPSEELLGEICQAGCHVVAKQAPNCSPEDREFLWRFSFSEAEKTIMKKMDAGNPNSGRRRVLQILKAIISNDPQLGSAPLRSYHMKTLIFWESETYPSAEDWGATKLEERFLSAVQRILSNMKRRSFPHYFLNNVNLVAEFKDPHFLSISRKFEEIKTDPLRYFQSATK